jgi:LacI family transcriptional regulator
MFMSMAPQTAQPVTLQDIAEKVGVSRDTVSRILNRNATYQRPALARRAQRIRDVAARMGYRANAAARATRSGRFQRIGLILPFGQASYIPHGLIGGLNHVLAEKDHQLTLAEMPDPDAGQKHLPSQLREMSVDGLLCLGLSPEASIGRVVAEMRLPTIWLNEQCATNAVYPDEKGAGRRITEYLLRCGHRRILLLDIQRAWRLIFEQADLPDDPTAPPPFRVASGLREPSGTGRRHYSGIDRVAGYQQAMHKAGLDPTIQRIQGDNLDHQVARLADLLRRSDRPTAVVLMDEQAVPEIFAAASAAGIEIPGDLSLTTFSWGGVWRASVGMTCIRYAGDELGRLGVDGLLSLIEQNRSETPAIAYPGRLVVDRTVVNHEGKVSS